MRSDRRQVREAERRQKAEAMGNRFYRTLSILYTLILVAFVGALRWLDVLPAKYFYILVGVLLLISVFIVPVMFSRHGIKRRKRISALFAVLLIAGFGLGTAYLADTADFLNDISAGGGIRELKEDYYLIVKNDSVYTDVTQMTGANVGTCIVNDANYAQAKDELNRELSVGYKYLADLNLLFDGLAAGSVETINETTGAVELQEYTAVFISSASYESMKEQRETLAEETRVLHTVSIKLGEVETVKAVDVTKEAFNVYVSGLDVQGDIGIQSRSDVNMIVTVNPATHEVLITSIPRDYYVALPTKNGAADKLTHSGLYGIQETMGAVEEMMGIEMNYYVKVNYSTIVKLVDAMGGIEIDSPYAFTTHGMADLGLNGITFSQGYNRLDGRMALAYCRERKSWLDGDMRRNENQQLIIEAIIKKMTGSTAILTNYMDILEAIRGNMETNMSAADMTSLVKMQLESMPSWNIEKTALKGKNDFQNCYALGFAAAVVNQDHEQIARTADKITTIMNNQ